MSYYEDVYKKRLNRYGRDFQSRIEGQREKDFDNYLLRSVYRVDFVYNGTARPATLEPYKQNYLQTLGYLLTKTSLIIPSGTILSIISMNGDTNYWMVWWLEKMQSSGYNRYVVLKMTNQITWKSDNIEYTQWFYFEGPGNKRIKDTLQQTQNKVLYIENNNSFLMVSARADKLKDGVYLEVNVDENVIQGFEVREKDIVSTPGVGYYTLDPVPLSTNTTAKSNPTTVTNNYLDWLSMDEQVSQTEENGGNE